MSKLTYARRKRIVQKHCKNRMKMQICYLSHGASGKLLFDEVSEHVVIKSVSSRTQILHCFYSQKSLKDRAQIDLKSFRK